MAINVLEIMYRKKRLNLGITLEGRRSFWDLDGENLLYRLAHAISSSGLLIQVISDLTFCFNYQYLVQMA